MSKYDALGTTLGQGTVQIETAVIVGTITGDGNATFTLTKAGMTGSPIATSVAVLNGDTPGVVATKAAAAMNLVANITAVCTVTADGNNVVVTAKLAAANDATFNLAYTNDTCTGLTPDATSTDTQAGAAYANIAQIQSISGPGLSLDTEDVTSHDSAGGWEEVVGTILRSGEMTMDLVYDPADDSHDDAGGLGLVHRMDARQLSAYKVTFPDSGGTIWYFNGYVTGFEPSMPHDGALTASATIKLTGAPILA